MKEKNYIEKILNKLGSDYTYSGEIIPKTANEKIKVKHKLCNNFFDISWKNCTDNAKCPFCFHRGIEKDYYKNLVNSSYNGDFEFISTEIKNTNDRFFKIRHKNCLDSKNDGFLYSMVFFKKKRPLCPFCESSLTNESLQKKLDSLFPNQYKVIGNFEKMNTSMEFIHIPCGHKIKTRPNIILNLKQTGCKFCRSMSCKNKLTKSNSEFEIELKKKFGDRFIIYDKYQNCHTKLNGYDYALEKPFYLSPSVLLSKSPIPHRSKGEIKIENFLKINNIEFETEKKFDDLKDIFPLRFDFYIKSLNLLIEYDGEQHFKPMRFDLDGKKLEITKKHDKMKNEYAKNKNLKLVRIDYKSFNDIEEILNDVISSAWALNFEN